MITQTLAILHDAYRELNSKKLFWIVLALSLIIMIAFAGFAADDQSITYFGLKFPNWGMPPRALYKSFFTSFVIGFWLTWAATITALVSTASIFPDFISGGSIDLFLSKPISRLRLFITKYISGLLFVALQVLIVCGLGFFILGLRSGGWYPGIFWGIPIVVCFFSYLFSICVLLGLLTRSTLAALFLTVLFWVVCFGISATEITFLNLKTDAQLELNRYNWQIDSYDQRIARMTPSATTQPTTQPEPRLLTDFRETRAKLNIERDNSRTNLDRWQFWHNIFYRIKSFLPKTGETIDLLDRKLLTRQETSQLVPEDHRRKRNSKPEVETDEAAPPRPRTDIEVQTQMYNRSTAWIVGTSLLFELAVLSLSAWLFQRRDF